MNYYVVTNYRIVIVLSVIFTVFEMSLLELVGDFHILTICRLVLFQEDNKLISCGDAVLLLHNVVDYFVSLSCVRSLLISLHWMCKRISTSSITSKYAKHL